MNRRMIEAGPLPVTRAYRQMYEHAEESAAFHSIALFSEPLIKWYGVLALVVLHQHAPERLREGGLLPQFLSPSLGNWVQIVRLAAQLRPEALAGSPVRLAFDELSSRQPEGLKSAMKRVEDYLGTSLAKRSLLDFLEGCVAYRNKTRGHGAPSMAHQAEFAAVFRDAWEEFLEPLESFYQLKLMYVERSENFVSDAIHILRACNGLNSTVLTEKMTLPKARSLSSRSVHLFSADNQPLLELSPILVRHPRADTFCYLNSGRKALEYLCYDGNEGEYYRPEVYDEAVRLFFDGLDTAAPETPGPGPRPEPAPAEDEPVDLPFGSLGQAGRRRPSRHGPSTLDPGQLARWVRTSIRAFWDRR